MNNFDIYVDSAANLPQDIIRQYQIKVVPFTYTLDGVEYSCYYDDMPFRETATKFYEQIENGVIFKTSLVSAQKMVDACEESAKAGRDIIFITITSGLSGTFNQACEAKKIIEEKYPAVKFYPIDSANASMGEGLLALRCARLRELGESSEACATWCVENAYKINSYLTVGDLKYLKRSGRISAPLAFAGTILNIKPIIKADGSANAKLVIHGKERGRKKAIGAIVENFKLHAINPENNTVAIAHAGCPEDAEALAETVKKLGAKEVIIEYYDLCTVSHIGPGTLALFFFGDDRKELETAGAQKKTGLFPVRKKA